MAKYHWTRIATVEHGVPVFALKTRDRNVRRRLFGRFRAYVENNKIYVRSAQEWWSSPGLRAHELTHVQQDQWASTEKGYVFFEEKLGYCGNPYEWHAYAVGSVAAIGGYIKRFFKL